MRTVEHSFVCGHKATRADYNIMCMYVAGANEGTNASELTV